MSKPQYAVTVDGSPLSKAIQQRLIYIRVLDEASGKNSRFELQFDNRQPFVEPPAKGAKFTIAMGYDGKLRDLGSYEFDEGVIFGPPHTVTLIGHAISTASPFKATKNRSWHGQTVEQIFSSIASANGLTAKVDPSIGSKMIDHRDQSSQSDMGFSHDLAREYKGTMKVMNGTLYVGPIGSLSSGDGTESVVIPFNEVTRYEYSFQGRGDFEGASAKYYDKQKGEERVVGIGDIASKVLGSPIIHNDKDAAEGAAASAKEQADRTKETMNLTVPGNPLLMSKSPVTTESFPPPIPTGWECDKAEHLFSGKGAYTTMALLTLPSSANPGDSSSGTDTTETPDNKEGKDDHTVTEQVGDDGTTST